MKVLPNIIINGLLLSVSIHISIDNFLFMFLICSVILLF